MRTILLMMVLGMAMFAGCQGPATSARTVSASPVAAGPTIRINAGSAAPFVDSAGNTWAADTGFVGGQTTARDATLAIANAPDPGMFRSEHYSMDSFSQKLPNGKYLVKLYFAETYTAVTGPGGRVFSFNIQGRDFKDFDVWAKAGGGFKAYVESIPVTISDGTLHITFTANVQNPEINAIEIIPAH